jgi:hypothetical protein
MSYKPDADGYVFFGDVSRGELKKQCQYGSRYIVGEDGCPNLGKDLRFKGLDDPGGNYHVIKIHIDDINEFVRRYNQYQKEHDL